MSASEARIAIAARIRELKLTTGLNTVVTKGVRAEGGAGAGDRSQTPLANGSWLSVWGGSPAPPPRVVKNTARKILCAALAATSGLMMMPGAAGAQMHLQHAGLVQKGRELVLSVLSSEPVGLGKLEAHPDTRRAASRYLCFEFSSSAS